MDINSTRISRRLSQLTAALEGYRGEEPLATALGTYFKANPQMGGRDRRELRALAWAWFRWGRVLGTDWVNAFELDNTAIIEKIKTEAGEDWVKKIIPHISEFSPAIDAEEFAAEFLDSGKLHVLPHSIEAEEKLGKALRKNEVEHQLKGPIHILPLETKLDDWKLEGLQVVDLSSFSAIEKLWGGLQNKPSRVLDVCCGAGGKSLVLKYLDKELSIRPYDIRGSILKNYASRIKYFGYSTAAPIAADFRQPQPEVPEADLVVVDAPCTGSGTWRRAPENAAFFDINEVGKYARKSLSILINSGAKVKSGGKLAYLTCSVFKRENEENALSFLQTHPNFELESQEYFNYQNDGGDILFSAIFKHIG